MKGFRFRCSRYRRKLKFVQEIDQTSGKYLATFWQLADNCLATVWQLSGNFLTKGLCMFQLSQKLEIRTKGKYQNVIDRKIEKTQNFQKLSELCWKNWKNWKDLGYLIIPLEIALKMKGFKFRCSRYRRKFKFGQEIDQTSGKYLSTLLATFL